MAKKLTARQKCHALIDLGVADDLVEAAEQLLDMGEITQAQFDRIAWGR